MNTVKSSWIRELSKVTDASFISIQEHFRKSKTLDKFFKSEFPAYNSYVIPGYREPGQETGRPKAGLAQLSTKLLHIKKNRIATKSYRIQAQVLILPATNLLYLNAYMPCDPGTREYNDQELTEVLSEIQTIMNTADYDDVIFSADMNWHKGRNTGFADMVERFVETSGLVSVWDHFECDFTHMHVDLKSVSTIDHFLVNRSCLLYTSPSPRDS